MGITGAASSTRVRTRRRAHSPCNGQNRPKWPQSGMRNLENLDVCLLRLLQRSFVAFRLRLRVKYPGGSGSGSGGSGFGSASLDLGKFWTVPVPIPDSDKCLGPAPVPGTLYQCLLLWLRVSYLSIPGLAKPADNGRHCLGMAGCLPRSWWSIAAGPGLTWLFETIGDKPWEG